MALDEIDLDQRINELINQFNLKPKKYNRTKKKPKKSDWQELMEVVRSENRHLPQKEIMKLAKQIRDEMKAEQQGE